MTIKAIKEMSNERLIMALINLYTQETKAALKDSENIIKELDRRNIVNAEVLSHMYNP